MKVLVTQNARVFTPGDHRNVEAGETLELDLETAFDLIESGNAVAVDEPPSLPTSAEAPVEGTTSAEVPPEVYATQAALEHAAALGVDLADTKGTGKDGRVTKGDVEAALAAKEGQ